MLIPSRRISYLRHIIDSAKFKVYVPHEKIEKFAFIRV